MTLDTYIAAYWHTVQEVLAQSDDKVRTTELGSQGAESSFIKDR